VVNDGCSPGTPEEMFTVLAERSSLCDLDMQLTVLALFYAAMLANDR
jgi:hypothetical protein